MKKLIYIGLVLSTLTLAFFSESCKKDDTPMNPFSLVDTTSDTTGTLPLEPGTFPWLHKFIFEPECANPACHDGTFEPDFRTVESSYSTLVYHPVIKNNVNEDFTYRVVPFDTALSVLHERLTNCCFVNVDDRMPQDQIGIPLPQEDLDAVAQWILGGARNMFGQVPILPDNIPTVLFFTAFDSTYTTDYHEESNRVDSSIFNAMILPQNRLINIVVTVEDDITAVPLLQNNLLRTSPLEFDPLAGTAFPAVHLNFGGRDYWIAAFHTSAFAPGSTHFMRYYTNDGVNVENTEFPDDDRPPVFRTHWSFFIQP